MSFFSVFLIISFIFTFLSVTSNTLYRSTKWIGVTATSDNHYMVTINFILSFFIYYPNNYLIIYNMNLNSEHSNNLKIVYMSINSFLINKKYEGRLIYKYFNFSEYPSHFSIENYTWKQIMIYDCLIKYKTMIFWFDGGVEITGNLDYELNIAKKEGMYIEPSIYRINIFLPPVVANFFSIRMSELENFTTINIALIATMYSKNLIKEIIKPWVDCALNELCICPKGVSRRNYRYDQTTLFLILYKNINYKRLIKPVKLNRLSHKKQCDHRRDCKIQPKINTLLNQFNYV